jgi:hypothetical protein
VPWEAISNNIGCVSRSACGLCHFPDAGLCMQFGFVGCARACRAGTTTGMITRKQQCHQDTAGPTNKAAALQRSMMPPHDKPQVCESIVHGLTCSMQALAALLHLRLPLCWPSVQPGRQPWSTTATGTAGPPALARHPAGHTHTHVAGMRISETL